MQVESLREYAASQASSLKVDRDKGVLHGVRIITTESKNNRTYSAQSLASAMHLYENAKVFVDHTKPGESRSYRDRVGTLKAVRAATDGLFGDLHVNKAHPVAEQLFYDAEHAPENVGLSHDADAKTRRDSGGKTVIEEIVKVRSVDLVANPATTKGLFEGEIADALATDGESEAICAVCDKAVDFVREVTSRYYPRDTGPAFPTAQAKRTRLLQILDDWKKELTKQPDATGTTTESVKENHDMEFKDLTIESLTEHRKDIVDRLQGKDELTKLGSELKTVREELQAAQAKLTAFETKEAEAVKLTAIHEELKNAKLDVTNKEHVSEAFLGTLKALPDTAARKPLIDDRAALVSKLGKPGTPVTGAPPLVPVTESTAPSGRDTFAGIFGK